MTSPISTPYFFIAGKILFVMIVIDAGVKTDDIASLYRRFSPSDLIVTRLS